MVVRLTRPLSRQESFSTFSFSALLQKRWIRRLDVELRYCFLHRKTRIFFREGLARRVPISDPFFCYQISLSFKLTFRIEALSVGLLSFRGQPPPMSLYFFSAIFLFFLGWGFACILSCNSSSGDCKAFNALVLKRPP